MPIVKYRVYSPSIPPQRTQVPVPGWGGDPQPRADGSHEQVWHCVPFSEGARYGVEILYPHEPELRVRTQDGVVTFDAEWGDPPIPGQMWPPFRPFGATYYSYQLSLDLKVEPGWAVRFEPHPRFYADATNSVPIAVPALIRTEWWPMVFFLIFKAPAAGATHVFRKGDPIAQAIIIPSDPDLILSPMDEEEAAERELQSRRIYEARATLAKPTRWRSVTKTIFDGTYRLMMGAARARDRDR